MLSQKAPSAKRCIKTRVVVLCKESSFSRVRKHQAPKGALKLVTFDAPLPFAGHRAPSTQNLACNFPEHVSTSTRKPQNFNVLTSKLEGLSAELHATFFVNPAR